MSPLQQLALPFDEAPLWDASSLEAVLANEALRPVSLTLTDNRSVLLSFRRHAAGVELRLHRMFLHAPLEVVRALARSLRRRTRAGEGCIRRFMNDNLHRVRKAPRRMPALRPEGAAYDLREVFEALNRRFFGGGLRVPITWGRGGGRARRGGITFGSYDPVLGLIRVHPVLDRSEVPRYFVDSVVYHEMLHHHMGGVPDAAGRTVYHSRAFREAEARYPQHRQALHWEKTNLSHLVRLATAMERRRR